MDGLGAGRVSITWDVAGPERSQAPCLVAVDTARLEMNFGRRAPYDLGRGGSDVVRDLEEIIDKGSKMSGSQMSSDGI